MRCCLLSDYPAHISVEELGNQLLVLNMRTGDTDDECDECSLETWADAEKFSNGKKNLLRFPSRHFRGSFAHLSHFWFVTMLFLRRRFLQQKLSLLSWEPVLWPDIHFPQFWKHQWDRYQSTWRQQSLLHLGWFCGLFSKLVKPDWAIVSHWLSDLFAQVLMSHTIGLQQFWFLTQSFSNFGWRPWVLKTLLRVRN